MLRRLQPLTAPPRLAHSPPPLPCSLRQPPACAPLPPNSSSAQKPSPKGARGNPRECSGLSGGGPRLQASALVRSQRYFLLPGESSAGHCWPAPGSQGSSGQPGTPQAPAGPWSFADASWLGPRERCPHAEGCLRPWGPCACVCLPLGLCVHVFGVPLSCGCYTTGKVGAVDVSVGCVALRVCVSGCPHGEGRGRGRANPQASQGQPN